MGTGVGPKIWRLGVSQGMGQDLGLGLKVNMGIDIGWARG